MTDDLRMDLAHQFHYDIRNTTEESDDDVLLEAVRGKGSSCTTQSSIASTAYLPFKCSNIHARLS